jgi:hypothetical protein
MDGLFLLLAILAFFVGKFCLLAWLLACAFSTDVRIQVKK